MISSASRLVAGAQHEASGRLRDDPVSHVAQSLAREAELDVVLAAFTDIELGLRPHLRASLGAMPLVVVEPLHRFVDFLESTWW